MKRKNNFFEKRLYPVLSSIIASLMLSVYSKIENDDYFIIFSQIHFSFYLMFITILSLIYAIFYRNRHKRTLPYSALDPPYGYENIGSLNYSGVKWIVQIPRKSERMQFYDLYLMSEPSINKSGIRVDNNPLCLKCSCEIIEKRTIFGKYMYICPNCNTIIKNDKSIYTNREIVPKFARSKYN